MKPDKPQPEVTDRERAQLAEAHAKTLQGQVEVVGRAFRELGEAITTTWPFRQILRRANRAAEGMAKIARGIVRRFTGK